MAISLSELSDAVGVLSALAQDSRLAVFRLLVEAGPRGMPAGEIATAVEIPPATLSFHLRELSHAGLVSSQKEGRSIIYAADYGTMNSLMAFLSHNCCQGDPQSQTTCLEPSPLSCAPKGGI